MSSSSTESAVIDVTMPQMGVSVAEGTVVEWRKQVGDWVEADEAIGEVSTDKIDTEIPAPAAGRVVEILVEVGTTVDVGVTLARIATNARPGEAHASENNGPRAPATGAPPDESEPPSDTPSPRAPRPTHRRYSPVVQRIADEHDVDLDLIEGTGREGRVRKQDVMAHVARHRAPQRPADSAESAESAESAKEPTLHIESPYRPDAPSGPTDGPYEPPEGRALSRMRAQIGAHMKRSQETAATCTTWIEVDVSRIELARKELGITALPLIARCVIGALVEYPLINAWLQDDVHTVHEQVNLGIAVALGDDGLIVPVVRGAQDLSPEGLSRRIRDLARRARSRQLRPDDIQGATFTLTNPGQFGSMMATPVISQPQVAILDVEAITKRPVVVTDAFGEDAIAIRPMVILGLSWDHRALDGALAAKFLANVKRRVESYET